MFDRVCPSWPENAFWPDMAILPEIVCWPEIAFWPEWQSIRIEIICFFLARNGFSDRNSFLARNGFLIKRAYGMRAIISHYPFEALKDLEF